MPQPGRIRQRDVADDGWKGRSGTNIWGFSMTVDEARGIVYMPCRGPGGELLGRRSAGQQPVRQFDRRRRRATGKYKWHFQTVHHDIWDIGHVRRRPAWSTSAQNGRTIPALASVGKTGYMFILDRTTGKPVFGVEERPVPKGDVPGEWYSPTQPFPVKPPPLAKRELQEGRHGDRRRHDTRARARRVRSCGTRAAGSTTHGPFTPFIVPRRRRAAEVHDSVSRRNGRRELGRDGHRSAHRLCLHELARHVARRVGGEEEAGRDVQLRHGGIAAYRTIAPASTASGPFHVHCADQGRERQVDRQPAVSASAVGAADRRQRQHRRHRVADDARHHGSAAGGQAEHGRKRQRWPDRHGRRPRVRRRDQRSRGSARSTAKTGKELWVTKLEPSGHCQPDHLSGQERQAVRRHRRGDAVVVFALR